MANLTTFAADKVLDHLLGRTAYTMPTVWVGLFTTDPTEPAGTGGVEVSGGAYVRVQLSPNTAAAASGSAVSNADVTWPQATVAWGTILGLGLFDAASAGNLLASGPLSVSKTVGVGDTFSIPSGDLAVALS